VENVPAAQYPHTDAPDSLNVPASHTSHADSEVMPVPVPYVPAAHALQSVALLALAPATYVPATHATHWLNDVIPEPVSYVPPAHAVQLLSPNAAP
jgi:hypothetical protein